MDWTWPDRLDRPDRPRPARLFPDLAGLRSVGPGFFQGRWHLGALVYRGVEVVLRQTMFAQVVRHSCLQAPTKTDLVADSAKELATNLPLAALAATGSL